MNQSSETPEQVTNNTLSAVLMLRRMEVYQRNLQNCLGLELLAFANYRAHPAVACYPGS